MDWANFFNGVSHGLAVMGFQMYERNAVYQRSVKSTKPEPTSKTANMSTTTTTTDWNIFYGWNHSTAMANVVHSPSRVIFDWDWLYMNLRAYQEQPTMQAGFLLASGLTGNIFINFFI